LHWNQKNVLRLVQNSFYGEELWYQVVIRSLHIFRAVFLVLVLMCVKKWDSISYFKKNKPFIYLIKQFWISHVKTTSMVAFLLNFRNLSANNFCLFISLCFMEKVLLCTTRQKKLCLSLFLFYIQREVRWKK
jgi:hypothetical protein